MIAASGFAPESCETCTYTPVYYYTVCSSSDYYWKKDPEPTREEILRRWWEYLSTFLQKANIIPMFRKRIPFRSPNHQRRIHHERQYPRVVKYRNNRNP